MWYVVCCSLATLLVFIDVKAGWRGPKGVAELFNVTVVSLLTDCGRPVSYMQLRRCHFRYCTPFGSSFCLGDHICYINRVMDITAKTMATIVSECIHGTLSPLTSAN